MSLVIHDLSPEGWEKIRDEYDGWDVVSAKEISQPCVGCFSCWSKTPGECIIKDGFDSMGARIHYAEKIVVISKYTYGGFSGAIKNVFDRSLGYVLPQFEITVGETHHKRRYEEDKEFDFIFYGRGLGKEEKAAAEQYVNAVCANIRGHVGKLIFHNVEGKNTVPVSDSAAACFSRTVMLNGSMRGFGGNSGKLAKKLSEMLEVEPETVELRKYLKDRKALVDELEDTGTLILCMPLYVDGIPSQMIRLMETFEKEYKGGPKKIYLVSNMGLYESSQLINMLGAVEQWCERMGFEYCGGIGASAGELIGVLMQYLPFHIGPTKNIYTGMKKLAAAINAGEKAEDIFAEPYLFPRLLFMWIANYSWNVSARANGIKPSDLYRKL